MDDQELSRPYKRTRLCDDGRAEQQTVGQDFQQEIQCQSALWNGYVHDADTEITTVGGSMLTTLPPLLPKTHMVAYQYWQQCDAQVYQAPNPEEHFHFMPIAASTFMPQCHEPLMGDLRQLSPPVIEYQLPHEREFLQPSEPLPEVLIAYGSITGIPGTIDSSNSNPGHNELAVHLKAGSVFITTDNSNRQGKITNTTYSQMIASLLEEQSIHLHAFCTLDQQQRPIRKTFVQPCTLSITLYGPLSLLEDIGSWAQGYEVYLQDPKHCHLRARYCNPHRLSSANIEDAPWLSDFLLDTRALPAMEEIRGNRDLLDILSTRLNLEETEQPMAVDTTLQRHQRQALTFMVQRERGWNFRNEGDDVWQLLDSSHVPLFLNTVSSTTQVDEPLQMRGGVIADTMGLGKTLTMISLVTTDLDDDMAASSLYQHCADDKLSQEFIPATLIVVLPSLLDTWEEQVSQHLKPGFVRVFRHHGKARLSQRPSFRKGDIVLTSYHTVSAEWQPDANSEQSTLFSHCWRRIIIDEAHMIKNYSARMTKATCSLEAVSRWAVTATPLQNRLKDLGSLMHFLRAYPYDDPRRFDTDLSRLWKDGESTEAVKRLQHLSGCLILRRSKDAIDLPPRKDMLCPVDFTSAEREEYEQLRVQAITRIDSVLHERESRISHTGISYVNALQQIETLRLFCNLGQHYHNRRTSQKSSCDWKDQAQSTFLRQCEIQPIICVQCSSSTDIMETLMDRSDASSRCGPQATFFSCLRLLCSDCVDECKRLRQALQCGHSSSCPGAPVSTSTADSLDTANELNDPEDQQSGMPISSKVKAVLADLQTVPSDVKSIVFSTWRLSLDMVQHALDQQSIKSIRLDGRVPQKQRQSIIDQFQTDPSIRVMLLTLGCGAVGLTLTAASRAYLMEPHWNPTLEEQALARIHRLGQTRPVTTVRLYMRNSFEEEVMKVQTSKKDLAAILLSPHDGNQADTSMGALERLRSFL